MEETECLRGVVERVTFHSAETGWSVLRVANTEQAGAVVTVVVHQAEVFAGASMDFFGHWGEHSKYGPQFQCQKYVERQPASVGALEKYLGSGLIHGLGPKTAKKIVDHFGAHTLEVFQGDMSRLLEVRGIAKRKLEGIRQAWEEHRAIRHVMMFLQEHGVSTLFAVKIFKLYGAESISVVKHDPYRLARDIYGVGFLGADKIAMSLGFERDGQPRVAAGVAHVLNTARDDGHCFLTRQQIDIRVLVLLELVSSAKMQQLLGGILDELVSDESIVMSLLPMGGVRLAKDAVRALPDSDDETAHIKCYFAHQLFNDEQCVARCVQGWAKQSITVDIPRVLSWIERYCTQIKLNLSEQQRQAVAGIAGAAFSCLTGGPGCGKTTTTRVLVQLLKAMQVRVCLAAPTGRAAQRLEEVVSSGGYAGDALVEASTIHRLLKWEPATGGFHHNQDNPLNVDFLIIDESSMLDVSLAASLLSAVPRTAQVLLIGDPNQLPPVGPGLVLGDLLAAQGVCRFELTEVFRQARQSDIIAAAHDINLGQVPPITSPLKHRQVWSEGRDCLFVDAEVATHEQVRFVKRAKGVIALVQSQNAACRIESQGEALGKLVAADTGVQLCQTDVETEGEKALWNESGVAAFDIPPKFKHIDWEALAKSDDDLAELRSILKRIHPYSALHFGMSITDMIRHLYTKTIPEQLGAKTEIQILTPMHRGSVGAEALNLLIQEAVNPATDGVAQLQVGERIFRVGDRVLQRRNNYDLGVFNGDIGKISDIDAVQGLCRVWFRSGVKSQEVAYKKEDMQELTLAYAMSIHKSQGSEFEAVIVVLATQHFKMLFRNLVYTGLTRAKKLALFVGQRHALRMAVNNQDTHQRQTSLTHLLNDSLGH